MSEPRRPESHALKWLGLALLIACAAVLWPILPWVVLALWVAVFARRIHVPLTRALHQRPRTAALITVSMLVALVIPIVVMTALLVVDAVALVERLMTSDRVRELFLELASADESRPRTDLVGLVASQLERAWTIAHQLAGTATRTIIGLVIFVAGTYAFLLDGERWYAWLEDQVPISRSTLHRLADAFVETGRGLFVGVVGAGLAQATVATVVYLAVGVPQPFALGLLTFVFSLVPVIGTAIVWIPVAAGLALTERPGAAIVVVIAGVMLIGTIDNLVRPYLARRGRLQLPTYVVLISMFGGVMALGGWGLLAGPLILRLAKEVLAMLREQRQA